MKHHLAVRHLRARLKKVMEYTPGTADLQRKKVEETHALRLGIEFLKNPEAHAEAFTANPEALELCYKVLDPALIKYTEEKQRLHTVLYTHSLEDTLAQAYERQRTRYIQKLAELNLAYRELADAEETANYSKEQGA